MPPKKDHRSKLEQLEKVKQLVDSWKEQRLGVLLLNGFRYLYKSKHINFTLSDSFRSYRES